MINKKTFTRVSPVIPANIQHAGAFADTHLLFDWHEVTNFKGSMIDGVSAIVRGTDGAAQTGVAMELFFATSHIPTLDDGVNVSVDTAPASLGSSRAAVGASNGGWFNNLVGSVAIAASDYNDNDLNFLNIATKNGLNIPVSGDLYVAAIAKEAVDFQNTIKVNESNFGAETQTVITVDTVHADKIFAPGDVVHAEDNAVLGTIKTVDSDTQITLTKANVDAIENNDVLYCVSPIQLILSATV